MLSINKTILACLAGGSVALIGCSDKGAVYERPGDAGTDIGGEGGNTAEGGGPSGGGGSAGAVGGGGGADGGIGGDGGSGGGDPVCEVSFVTPLDDALFEPENCNDGVIEDVTVNVTDAADDATVTLSVGPTEAGEMTGTGELTFENVTLDPNDSVELTVEVDEGCEASITVTTVCAGPTCSIGHEPAISDTHPNLNGVAVADGGDRVSAEGSPYQTAFTVDSDAEGEEVVLVIDGNEAVKFTAVVNAGVATFGNIPLLAGAEIPDVHTVQATCTSAVGETTISVEESYTLDTSPPNIVATTPDNDAHFAKDVPVEICVQTDSADALNLAASLGAGQTNVSVSVNGANPTVGAAVTDGVATDMDGDCISFSCTGPAPKSYEITLKDGSGNLVTHTITGVTCASESPDVTIITPSNGVTGGVPDVDLDLRVLALGGTTALLDLSASAGAQANVIACTSAESGTARLLTGLVGGAMAEAETTTDFVAAVAQDGCPNGHDWVVTFSAATLTESVWDSDTSTLTATEVQVEVTADSGAQKGEVSTPEASAINLWVDSTNPSITILEPNPLCGETFISMQDITLADLIPASDNDLLNILTDVVPLSVTVTNGGQELFDMTYAVFENPGEIITRVQEDGINIDLDLGDNDIVVTGTEASGNVSSIGVDTPCTLAVGDPPPISFTASAAGANPVTGSTLNAAGDDGDDSTVPDADPNTAGWQGTLRVTTDVGATVDFTADGNPVGADIADGQGVAELAVTIADAASVTIGATADDGTGFGTGNATLSNIVVDTIIPDDISDIGTVTVRRRGFDLNVTWTAGGDGGNAAAAGYVVKRSSTPIASDVDFDNAQTVVFPGVPLPGGQTDTLSLTGLDMATDYYFAVKTTDAAGNMSSGAPVPGTSATDTAARGDFLVHLIDTPTSAVAGGGFGGTMDGSTDFGRPLSEAGEGGPDGYADLLVGSTGATGAKAFVYFGRSSFGDFPAEPDLEFDGTASFSGFGSGVAVVGDIDGDDKPDLAIGAPFSSAGGVFMGQVLIFKGGSWRPTAETTKANFLMSEADYTVTPVTQGDGYGSFNQFGFYIGKLGDFNADGNDDFAVGAHTYAVGGAGNTRGHVAVIFGGTITYIDDQAQEVTEDFGDHPITLGSPSTPADFVGRATAYVGRDITGANFGASLLGAGPVLTGSTNSLLVGSSGTTDPELNRVYIFPSIVGQGPAFTFVDENDLFVEGAVDAQFGLSMARIDDSYPNGPAIAVGHQVPNGTDGTARLYMGNDTAVFTGKTVTIANAAAADNNQSFGIVMGSGFSGSSNKVNIIGSDTGDLVVTSFRQLGTRFAYVIDGDTLTPLATSSSDVADLATVSVSYSELPEFDAEPWDGTSPRCTVANDINNDGFGEILIGEVSGANGGSTLDGRMVILY